MSEDIEVQENNDKLSEEMDSSEPIREVDAITNLGANINYIHQLCRTFNKAQIRKRLYLIALPIIVGALILGSTLWYFIPNGYTTEYHESFEYDPDKPTDTKAEYHPWTGQESWSAWYLCLFGSFMMIAFIWEQYNRTVDIVKDSDTRFRVIGSVPFGNLILLFGPKMTDRYIRAPKKTILSEGIKHEIVDTVHIYMIHKFQREYEFLSNKLMLSIINGNKAVNV